MIWHAAVFDGNSTFQYSKVSGWLTSAMKAMVYLQDDLLNLDIIFFPMWKNSHYSLGVVYPKRMIVTLLDSSGNITSKSPLMKTLLSWIEHELGDRFDSKFWTTVVTSSIQQQNVLGCGVCACINALSATLGKSVSPDATADGMINARHLIAGVLLDGGFVRNWSRAYTLNVPFRFLDLPAELRNGIYDCCIDQPPNLVDAGVPIGSLPVSAPLPSLLFASHQTCNEMFPLWKVNLTIKLRLNSVSSGSSGTTYTSHKPAAVALNKVPLAVLLECKNFKIYVGDRRDFQRVDIESMVNLFGNSTLLGRISREKRGKGG